MPKPPVDPGYFDKVNYVIDAWANPCEAPWYIYVETMGPALLEAFIVLMTFGWDDVARGYFRPKGLRGKRHGRKGKRTGRLARFFPEIGEEVGKRLPGAKPIGLPTWGSMGRNLWRIDSVLQRGMFYWLVADVTLDFAFNWTSLLYETQWCKAAELGGFSYHNPNTSPESGGSWHVMGFGVEDYEHAPPSWGFLSGNAGPRGCSAGAGMNFEKAGPFAFPANISVRLTDMSGATTFAITNHISIPGEDNAAIPVMATLKPGTKFRVEMWHDGSWVLTTGGSVFGVGLEG